MSGHTPGPWTVYNMVHKDHGRPLTPEELGEYVRNNVLKSVELGGTLDRFLFVSTGEGDPDICHVGNGPKGPANARLIAAAPDLLSALKGLCQDDDLVYATDCGPPASGWRSEKRLALWAAAEAAIAKAEGKS